MTRKITRVALLAALRAGANAGKAGKPLRASPYDNRADLANRFLHRYWLHGWRNAGGKP